MTVEPATAAALEADADATHTSVSAVIRDALARGLPLIRDALRKRRSGPRSGGGAGGGGASGANTTGRDCCFAAEGRAGDVAVGCRRSWHTWPRW